MAAGDLLMSVYLLMIAGVDLHYRGVYAAYEEQWRTSASCQLAGFISTLSTESSVISLTIITVDRLLVIKFPFGDRRLDMRVTRAMMLGMWVVVTFLAALPLANIAYFDNFYGRSGVCLALHITSDKPNGWEYSVLIFIGEYDS
ncbi:hypothetical protein HAZT_HAZT012068 [Hyalella azteca]|uniref:G-protein coupled receptors family 1 profile domain-containing protein n=1 Tax=Hyalella azteca TaxID=294128 RepID=A0A6A0H6A1_HYAAZ|nr:hypothetical protein HAZT_HAZT012068 [Hyalella azteca]